MTDTDVVQIGLDAMMLALKLGGPSLMVTLGIGLAGVKDFAIVAVDQDRGVFRNGVKAGGGGRNRRAECQRHQAQSTIQTWPPHGSAANSL